MAGVGAAGPAHAHLPWRAADPAHAGRRALGSTPRTSPGSAVHYRPEWVAAAHAPLEYDEDSLPCPRPACSTPAWILGAAADHLDADPDVLDRLRGCGAWSSTTRRSSRPLPWVCSWSSWRRRGRPGPARRPGRRHADLPGRRHPALRHRPAGRSDPGLLSMSHRCGWPGPRRGRPGGRSRRGRRGGRPTAEVVAGPHGGEVEAHALRMAAQRPATSPAWLREAHLLDGVPVCMAVVVRGGGRTATLRRVLRGAGASPTSATADLLVRDEAAVLPFLTLLAGACSTSSPTSSTRPTSSTCSPPRSAVRMPGAAAAAAALAAAAQARRRRGRPA